LFAFDALLGYNQPMSIGFFVIAFLGVFALLSIYIKRRLIDHLHIAEWMKSALRVFLMLNFVGIIGYMGARYFSTIPNWLYFLLSLPIGVLFLLFCTTLVYDILRVSGKYMPMQPQRRNFFKKSLDITSLAMAFGVSARATYEARIVELEKVDIVLKKLSREYRVVQLSDIHIGGLIDTAFMQGIVDRVNALKPDLVVITGDLIDVKIAQAGKVLDTLKALRSTYGTFFIVGNHEYFHGIEAIMGAVKKRGIKVLENESVYIGEKEKGFHLAGVYDLVGYRFEHHRPDLYKALKQTDKNSPIVLLAHQPLFIEEADRKVDLILSGHTHGGQIYPFKALVRLQQPYLSGLHKHSEYTQVYVNKGTGYWGPPMRLGASSEITYIKLKQG
jgi:predicted MPP superfamily phosphohydrolase